MSEPIPMRPLRVAVVDDHTLMRDVLVQALHDAGFTLGYAGADPQELLRRNPAVDVVLLDLDLGDGREASVAEAEDMMARGWRVLIVSAMGRPAKVREFLKSQVAGFVPKWESMESLVAAIRAADGGAGITSRELAGIIVSDDDPSRPQLSDQELLALRLYASGLTMGAVAKHMNVAPNTAKEYVARVRAKYAALGRPAHTKTDLYREARRDQILDD